MGMTLTEEIIQAALVAPDERKAEALRMLRGETPPPSARPALTGPLLFSIGAASKLLGISRVTLWRVLREGKIKRVELFPGAFRVTREDIESLLAGKFGISEFPRKRGRPRKEGWKQKTVARSEESVGGSKDSPRMEDGRQENCPLITQMGADGEAREKTGDSSQEAEV